MLQLWPSIEIQSKATDGKRVTKLRKKSHLEISRGFVQTIEPTAAAPRANSLAVTMCLWSANTLSLSVLSRLFLFTSSFFGNRSPHCLAFLNDLIYRQAVKHQKPNQTNLCVYTWNQTLHVSRPAFTYCRYNWHPILYTFSSKYTVFFMKFTIALKDYFM